MAWCSTIKSGDKMTQGRAHKGQWPVSNVCVTLQTMTTHHVTPTFFWVGRLVGSWVECLSKEKQILSKVRVDISYCHMPRHFQLFGSPENHVTFGFPDGLFPDT